MSTAALVLRYFQLAELVNRLQVHLAYFPKDSTAALQLDLAKADEAVTWALVLAAT
jgi:hypothetical protein